MSYFTIGSTGLVGSHFLSKAIESNGVNQIFTLTRKEIPTENDKLIKIVSKDTNEWYNIIKESKDVPIGSTFFSSFGTTRKIAGSGENFVKIDHGINYLSFKSAKESGKYDTAIIVSSRGSNKDSFLLYLKTKGKLEQDIIDLKFKRTIILKPGILLGKRETPKDFNNTSGEIIGSFFRGTFIGNLIGYPVYAEEVAKAALKLSLEPIKSDGEVITVSSEELIELAK
ncbi:Protein fmp52, mitochondrial [Pichia californica]|uniref:Protein fmp52, mitochondrial n=1 Tax=Pichia californica TaxID=460514 RepID=A0A9P7BCQ0_9ASCO|nr:Protein fmp52, mitochondrial [[Candida] californica]KAG0687197.1 Protein fmp52, mitochondrial [[Candida] californica]